MRTQDPQDREILRRAAHNALRLNDRDEALARFERLLQRFPDDRDARIEYAGQLVIAGRLREAGEAFQIVLRGDPEDLATRRALASVFQQSQELAAAEAQLWFVLERKPDDHELALDVLRVRVDRGDQEGAFALYVRFLEGHVFADDEHQFELVRLLLRVGRPLRAALLLQSVEERCGTQPEWVFLNVEARAPLGSVRRAGMLDEIRRLPPSFDERRLELARRVMACEDVDLAFDLCDQVLGLEPGHEGARLLRATLALDALRVDDAQRALDAPLLDHTSRRWRALRARWHGLRGEWANAEALWRQLLDEEPGDHEARLQVAVLYATMGDRERARGMLALVPEDSLVHRATRIALVRMHRLVGNHTRANALARELIAADRGDVQAMILWLEGWRHVRNLSELEAAVSPWLQRSTDEVLGMDRVRVAWARVLLGTKRAREAERLLADTFDRPLGHRASVLMAWREIRAAGTAESWRGDVPDDEAARLLHGDETLRVREIVGSALALGHHELAAQVVREGLAAHPDDLVLLHLQVTIEEQARGEGHLETVVGLQRRILSLSPRNTRARLELARALARLHRQRDALMAYDTFLAEEGPYAFVRLERARLLDWMHAVDRAREAFQELTVDEPLSFVPGSRLPTARGDVLGRDVDRAVLEVHRELARDEWELRSLVRDDRLLEAIPRYRDHLARDESSPAWRFDLAQALARTNQTHASNHEYERLLETHPDHREARLALERGRLRLRPSGALGFSFRQSQGTDGSSRLTESAFEMDAVFPFDDEDDFVRASFRALSFDTETNGSDTGNVARIGIQTSPFDRETSDTDVTLDATLGIESYSVDLDQTMTFDAGLTVRPEDTLSFSVRVYRENVIENANSLAETLPVATDEGPVSRLGTRLRAAWHPSERWNASLDLVSASYSDSNSLFAWNLYGDYRLLLSPGLLSAYADVYWMNFSTDVPTGYNQSIGSARYFAPNGYATYTLGGRWRQDMGRDRFHGASGAHYEFDYGFVFDVDGQTFHRLSGAFRVDLTDRIDLSVDASFLTSAFYETVRVAASLRFRL
ncbi:MAG: tetratricopeptide repeat protein [Planctomycetes bacterium]|nr:tetratricopeptide repeat protein [Planctomycetota bacterium]